MRIICVCGTGQGSSLILRMSIEEILSNHGYKAEVEHTDPSCACGERCDYIVTSKEIPITSTKEFWKKNWQKC